MNNFNPELERAHQDGTEWQFGSVATDLALVPLDVRVQYTPIGVPQYNKVMDTDGCASRAPLNILETKFTYFFHNGMHPTLKKWLEDNKYIENDKVVFNDAFIEILSGTTQQGNSLKAPLDTIRKQGLLPRYMLPLEDTMTWDEYMDVKRITPAMYLLASEFKKRFTINYEQVFLPEFPKALAIDLLTVSGHGWPTPVNNVYPRVEDGFNHAFANINPDIDALDNYNPFVKRLAKDYKFFDWGYSLSITSQNPTPESVLHVFKRNLGYGMIDPEVAELQKALMTMGYTIPHAVTNMFGNETRAALFLFQQSQDIIDDGSHFGPRTRYAMNCVRNPSPTILGAIQLLVQTFLGI